MAQTKEGGELKAANLPNWLVLEPKGENLSERKLRSKASVVSWLSYLILIVFLPLGSPEATF